MEGGRHAKRQQLGQGQQRRVCPDEFELERKEFFFSVTSKGETLLECPERGAQAKREQMAGGGALTHGGVLLHDTHPGLLVRRIV